MQKNANVVPITPNREPSATGQLPAQLIRVRDKAVTFFKEHLQELYAHADDLLFDLADRASSNQAQTAYFETMRELRLQQKNLLHSFLQQLFESFADLTQFQIGQAKTTTPEVDHESLALVQNDELEETVAINTMVSKVLMRDEDLLEHLSSRFKHLLKREITSENNPLGPQNLSSTFLSSCAAVGITVIETKLLLLKLFDRTVLEDLAILYSDSNQTLIDAGVLPDLRSRGVQKKPRAGSPAAKLQAQSQTITDPESGETIELSFNEIQRLLKEFRQLQPSAPTPDNAVAISTQDLMRLLSHLQQHTSEQENDSAVIRKQIDGILNRASKQSDRPRVIGEVDNDAINLVSMLFEFILEDQGLPDSLKALISRLQIPMLKVAVLEQDIFNSASHPARRLLNELGQAALGWNAQESQQQDKLHQKIEMIVHRLVTEFTNDTQIFSELLEDFLDFNHVERRRSDLVEQRLKDAEEGRARTLLARKQIEDELNKRLQGQTLPETIVRLLQEWWSKVLLLQHLRHGAESKQWLSSVAIMDHLIWSVSPEPNAQSAAKLKQLVPKLLTQLRKGFDEAALDPFAIALLFTELEVLHIQAFQKLKQALKSSASANEDTQGKTTPDAAEAPVVLAPQELPEILHKAAKKMAETPQPIAPTFVEVTENIVLSEQAEDTKTSEKIVEQLPDDAPEFESIDQLQAGSWFELIQEDDSKIRCKLSAIIKSTQRYIFVNRHGLKVFDKNRNDLALAFKNKDIRLLDDALLFDRALESVIGSLRRLKTS